MKKRAFSLAMATLLLVSCCALLVSCGSSDGISGTKWVVSGGDMNGTEVSSEDLVGALGEYLLEFKDGGKASVTAMGTALEGTYKISGNSIIVTYDGGTVQEFVRDGDNMSMSQDMSGLILTVKFSKK